ncbi:hypothetical protein [Azospirillum thermophilum]|uniref:Uncharacterized protein n=1 Tax=Azospirillum thermophilum TaxID=2202148 RepID=A0A2S2CKU6_9PROT|nr:hypothetical protein [Azospirillum thermophilum]AWK85102.1 hypothetical protein DEW08_01915 [Azospirillum thermophilum]
MSIDRTELERLLADRPTGNRSAMQAVRECYGDIGLMRERGLSWAEISDVLAQLGVTARDDQPISPVTLRSAFFLVGNEAKGGEVPAEPAGTTPPETLAAVHQAALAAGRPAGAEEAAAAPDPAAEAPEDAEPDAAEPDREEPAPGKPDAGQPEAPASVAEERPEPVADPVAEKPDPGEKQTARAPAGAEPAAAGVTGAAKPATAEEPAPPPPAAAQPEVPQPEVPPPAVPQPAVSQPPSPLPGVKPTHNEQSTNVYWKGDRMLGTIFVLNDRGGVGKTLLSHHLMATAMLEGLQLKVVEYEVNERLARLFGPDVVEHRRITQDFMNMMGSGDGFYEFWDQIGPELQRGGRLYDFGGNISQWFFNWAEVSGFDYYVGDGERLTFMVPVTVDLASLSTGMSTLERVAAIAPKAKRVLVENGFSGPFSQLEDSQYARRKAEMVEREGLQVISMPPCTAPAWARLTGHRIDQVASMTREDLVKLGMTPPVASRSLIIIHEWLRGMRQSLSPYLHDAFRQTPAASKAGAR